MLNEIRQNEELRNRRLVDLYEEGILELGDEVPYIHREETYVSLKEKIGFGNQEFSTKDLDMEWQAIGVETIDGNKCLKLIAKDPVFSKFILKGARGCVYGINEMHRICSFFATGAGALKGRSITIEDVNQLLDVVVDEEQRIVYQKGYKKDINRHKDFLKKCLFDEEFTPESYLKGEKLKKEIIETCYIYKIGSIIGKEKEKNIIQRSVDYWLASPRVYAGSDYAASFGPGAVIYGVVSGDDLFRADGHERSYFFAVRPILYLKSNETFSSLLGRKENISRLSIENLLEQLEEKRQERQKIEKEEEKIIKQLEEIIR